MSSRTYNFQAGLLMTILIGAAFVIHRDQEALYFAGGGTSAPAGQQSGQSSDLPPADSPSPAAAITVKPAQGSQAAAPGTSVPQ